MSGPTDGMPVADSPRKLRPGGYVQSLILKLEDDIQARKRPRGELWPAVRTYGLLGVALLLAFELGARSVDTSAGWTARVRLHERLLGLNGEVDALKGQIEFQKLQIERLQRAQQYSNRYGISAELALAIYDIAHAENIDPSLAFELVRVESEFNPRAVSPVGALGFTQLMPATARLLVPGITREGILDRDTNLRLGFRFLRTLVNRYNGDIRLALLAYNRGPERVDRLLKAGIDPGNGYVELVLGK